MRLTVEGAATRLEGPLLFLRRTLDVGLNDAVEVRGGDGRARLGRVAAIDDDIMTIEVLESTAGLGARGHGRALLRRAAVVRRRAVDARAASSTASARSSTAARRSPRASACASTACRSIPVARAMPRDFIETGITTLDLMNSLVRGQKLPLFSGGGLPHDRLAVEIAPHARLRTRKSGDFAIVFAGIGVPYDSAEYFRRSLEQGGALERTALFLNLASDSSTQRLLTPRFALTAAEYLAFDGGKHVLVILTDMTNYCEALREVSSSKGEIPSRKGFPGYMYSDLATLFERAGCIARLRGHADAAVDPDDARRRHRPSDPRPHRLHHRRARSCCRATSTAAASIRRSTCCRACRG